MVPLETLLLFEVLMAASLPKARKTVPLTDANNYGQYMRYISLWFDGVLASSPEEFSSQSALNHAVLSAYPHI